MTLTDVRFTIETLDEDERRVIVMTFTIAPFTAPLADDLNIKSVLFAAGGTPKDAFETVVVHIDAPLQWLTFAMGPDETEHRIVLPEVTVIGRLKAKVKRDREPFTMDVAIEFSVRHLDAETLLYIANGVNATHYLTLDPEQSDLLTGMTDGRPRRGGRGMPAIDAGDELRPGVQAEH
jgi:hypothetical protein